MIQDWFGPTMLKVTVFQFSIGLFCAVLVFFYVCVKMGDYLDRLAGLGKKSKTPRD